MKKILICVLFLIISSCGAGWSDVLNDLGNGYYYLGEGSPVNYIYRSMKPDSKSIDKIIIYPNVSSYDCDRNHIVVFQELSYESMMYAITLEKDLDIFSNTEERELAEKKADSILKNDPHYKQLFLRKANYWIISKKDHQVYGPYSKAEYEAQRKELGVSEDLVLEE